MDQTLQIPQEIRAYLESLLDDAQMTTLDSLMREEMIQELYTRFDNFLTGTIVDNLPAEHMEDFVKLNEKKGSQAEIETFLKDKMPNAQQVFSDAFIQFRDLYLGNVAATRNAPKAE